MDYADPIRLAKETQFRDLATCGNGQISVVASVPQNDTLDITQAIEIVKGHLQSHGRLFAFVHHAAFPNGSFKSIAEFCDASAAVSAMLGLQNLISLEGIHLSVSPNEPHSITGSDPLRAFKSLSLGRVFDLDPQQHTSSTSRSTMPASIRATSSFSAYPLMLQSPIPQGIPYMFESFYPAGTHGHFNPLVSMPSSFANVCSSYHSPPSPALTAQKKKSVLLGRCPDSAGSRPAEKVRCASAGRRIITW